MQNCQRCSGSGQARHPSSGQFVNGPCPDCHGSGYAVSEADNIKFAVTGETGSSVNKQLRAEPPTTYDPNAVHATGISTVSEWVDQLNYVAKDARVSAPVRANSGQMASTLLLRNYGKPRDSWVIYSDEAEDGGKLLKAAEDELETIGLTGPDLGATQAQQAREIARATSSQQPQRGARDQLASVQDGSYTPHHPQPQQSQLNYKKELQEEVDRLEKQAAEATSPLERQRLGDALTLKKLTLLSLATPGRW